MNNETGRAERCQSLKRMCFRILVGGLVDLAKKFAMHPGVDEIVDYQCG